MPTASGKLFPARMIPVDQLLLDATNPRLSLLDVGPTQQDIVKAMWQEMVVAEVAISIAENGFFPEEPLLAIPATQIKEGKKLYTVVEGNRRLTAVMLLTKESLRRTVRANDLPVLNQQQLNELKKLPVAVYPNKESLWEYFGFRHVNGPKEWDALAKATYVAEVRKNYGMDLPTIARKIGDQNNTVARFYRGYVLLEQAERRGLFNRENCKRNRLHFSHLYTAAAYPSIQKFLGINDKDSLVENPVKPSNHAQLKELMIWLFGDVERDKEPLVQNQNPDLSRLRDVIANRTALNALRSGISLERSFAISKGDSRRFEEALVNAKDALQELRGTVTIGYKGDIQLLNEMEGVCKLGNAILDEMRSIKEAPRKSSPKGKT